MPNKITRLQTDLTVTVSLRNCILLLYSKRALLTYGIKKKTLT